MKKTNLVLLSALLAITAVCTVRAGSDEADWTRIADGISGIEAERTVVVTDQDAWSSLWKEHTAIFKEAPPLRGVDFTESMIVGVFLGQRLSGGYSVEMALSVVESDPLVLEVRYTENKPLDEAIAVMSQPFALRKVPRIYATVRFFPPKGEQRVFQVLAAPAQEEQTEAPKKDMQSRTDVVAEELGELKDGLHGSGVLSGQAAAFFDGKTAHAAMMPGISYAVASGDGGYGFMPVGLPPPPGSKTGRSKKLPDPPKKGKKLPAPPKKGKKLPPPPDEGKKLPPPPGRRLPTPAYPGGPLSRSHSRLQNAERAYSTYQMSYIGFWYGDVYYRTDRGVVETSPADSGNTYVMRLTSNRYQEYVKFYYESGEDRIYYVPVESKIDSRSRTLDVRFVNRDENPLMPWEREKFVFTLKKTQVGLESSDGAYSYEVSSTVSTRDSKRVVIRMEAVHKIKIAPDSRGVSAGIKKSGGRLVLTVTDKWAQYYSGETLELDVVIKRSEGWSWGNPFGIDPVVLKKTIRVPARNVQDADLTGLSSLKSGDHYLSSWSFRRKDSRISTGGWIRKGEGNSIRK